jgi:hypothetical protein
MTSYSFIKIDCPCGKSINASYPISICTWLNPNLIEEFLEGTLFSAKCKSCDQVIKIKTSVLMNTPRGMWYISTNKDSNTIKTFFILTDVMNGDGRVYSSEEMYQKLEYNKTHRLYQKLPNS